MRFLIDVHHIGMRATGNETWAREVAQGMARVLGQSATHDELLYAVATAAGRAAVVPHPFVDVSGSSSRRLLWDLPHVARRNAVDALLVQYTAPRSASPCVVAIHDLSFTDPASARWIPALERARMQATIRWSAKRAGKIVALSRHTARDLRDRWEVDPDRIVVAYPAVGATRSQRLRCRNPRPRAAGENRPLLVLAVGNVVPRKNLPVLGMAIRLLRERGLDVVLRVVGQIPPAGRGVRSELERICGDWLTVGGYASEAELLSAYHEADAFCLPSLYEGFGLPVLEAMTAGVPTLVSDATALPEAIGDAGRAVDPYDPVAWADALELVLTDESTAARMRLAGLAHVARFSWDDTSTRVIEALRAVAE